MNHPGNTKRNGGYAILELLFYIAFFCFLSIALTNATIAMARSFREAEIYSELARGGTIMESITREVRQAESISSLSASSLRLNSKDEAGSPRTVEFALSGNNLRLWENDVFAANLNAPSTTVSGLSFSEITSAEGKGVRIILTVRSNNDASARPMYFYNTVVLRGNY